jgi:hypothetical protein
MLRVPHRSESQQCKRGPTAQNEHVGIVLLNDLGRMRSDNSTAKTRLALRKDFAPLFVWCDSQVVLVAGRNESLAERWTRCANFDDSCVRRPDIGRSHVQAARRRFSSVPVFSAR